MGLRQDFGARTSRAAELRVARLDLDPATTLDGHDEKLAAALLHQAGSEAQWALRGGSTYVARLTRCSQPPQTPLHLVVTQEGRLDSLEWQPSQRRAPGAGQVEIRVHATGLNFRDVLSALGMYPGDAGPLGGEVAGVVVAVGSGVDRLAIGDAVAAFAVGAFDDYVVTAADLTLKKPADWSFAEIATVPAAFATAYHALVQLAKVHRGQRVLIHAAAGGVGLAAVQIAQAAGCDIVATAGSPEKRGYLQSLGVSHVFDSRSTTYADDVRQAFGKRPIDVIVNSLSGELIDASMSLLAPDGCFVELGKRGIWDASSVAALLPQARYHVVDLAAHSLAAPAEFRPIFAAATEAMASGAFRPLPLQIFSREEVQSAFRHMAQAKHIGKIVIAGSSMREPIVSDRFEAKPTAQLPDHRRARGPGAANGRVAGRARCPAFGAPGPQRTVGRGPRIDRRARSRWRPRARLSG